jgi:1-acyl-sn-glycerol-3-phosphate acyltransferase
LKRDVFGNIVLLKKFLVSVIGAITYPRYKWLNRMDLQGTEHLERLPAHNVLFISNHQTYFADVIAMLHVFNSVKWRFRNKLGAPVYLLAPKHNNYFVAAEETMKTGLLPKLFAYAGSVSIKRTFREAGEDINRPVKMEDITRIGEALSDGWVITFPQGTTTPFAPGRRGVTHVIKKFGPVVIPVVIDGFGKAFDKKGLKKIKRGVKLSMRFKAPMEFAADEDPDLMLERIMDAIEQSERYRPAEKK